MTDVEDVTLEVAVVGTTSRTAIHRVFETGMRSFVRTSRLSKACFSRLAARALCTGGKDTGYKTLNVTVEGDILSLGTGRKETDFTGARAAYRQGDNRTIGGMSGDCVVGEAVLDRS